MKIEQPQPNIPTLDFLISVLHAYLFLGVFSFQHALIRDYMFINFWDFFLPTRLFKPWYWLKKSNFFHSKSFFPPFYNSYLNLLSIWGIKMHIYMLVPMSFSMKYRNTPLCVIQTGLFHPNTFIEIFNIFLPTCLFQPTRLLIFQEFSIQHVYSNYTFIRDSKVLT